MSLTLTGVLGDASILQPKIVVTSPKTGNKLYVNPATFIPGPSTASNGSPGIEFPFSIALSSGAVPNDGKSTDSISEFVSAEKWTLLEARGPFGLPWWVWLLGLLTLASVPYIPLLLKRNK